MRLSRNSGRLRDAPWMETARKFISMKRIVRNKKAKSVSASELAQMGVCERLVVFEHRYGKRHTASQHAAIRHGLKEHDQFYQDGVRMSARKGRCYIATLMFGTAQETTTLRIFRDQVLRPNATGRWLIVMYYKTAPGVCAMLERWPWLQPIVRAMLRPVVWAASRVLHEIGGDHDA